MKAQLLSFSFLLTWISMMYAPAMAEKKDFALYFEQHSDGTATIRVKAIYYTKKGDTNSKEAAISATEFWNKKSGEFKVRISSQNNNFEYSLHFDLNVIEVDDPTTEMYKDKTRAKDAITNDGASNSFTVVDNFNLGKIVAKTLRCNTIQIRRDMIYDLQAGVHEIGHTLLINHAETSSLSVMANGATGTTFVFGRDVRQIIAGAFDTPALNRITIHGLQNLPVGNSDIEITCKAQKRESRGYLKSVAAVE